MSIRHFRIGEGRVRRPSMPDGPEVEVVIGAHDGPPVALLQLVLPPGGGMPAHDHGASTTLLIPLAGSSQLVDAQDGARPIDLAPGTVAVVPFGQRVRLLNDGQTEARLLAVLSPPDFAAQVAGWPHGQRSPAASAANASTPLVSSDPQRKECT